MKKIVVLGSGEGTNFQAIAEYFKDKEVEIVCISDKPNSNILKRASNLGIENKYVSFEELEDFFKNNNFDLGVLAGYMRILPEKILSYCKFINIHPSLLPSFKGANAILDALNHGVTVTGVTIHHVDKTLDGGKIIFQYPVMIDEYMNLQDLKSEIQTLEHKIYPLVIETILQNKVISYSTILKSSCNSGCGSKGCKH